MKKEELKLILDNHALWVSNNSKGMKADLTHADLTQADLSNANLSRADLSNANLYNADLSNANLYNADLSNANLRHADLSNADLSNADLSNANLTHANLRHADLSNANLRHADLSNADLTHANLRHADLTHANLRHADLSNADLRDADLSNADLSNADLTHANLSRADLSKADLSNADLYEADFTSTLLRLSNLRFANNLLTIKSLPAAKRELFEKLGAFKNEAQGLYKAAVGGKIDGSAYEGDCACFVGTIANLLDQNYKELENLKHDDESLIERLFSAVTTGDTPTNNPISKIVQDWLIEFMGIYDIEVPTLNWSK